MKKKQKDDQELLFEQVTHHLLFELQAQHLFVLFVEHEVWQLVPVFLLKELRHLSSFDSFLLR